MSERIYKYKFDDQGKLTIKLPVMRILHVGWQPEKKDDYAPTVWAAVTDGVELPPEFHTQLTMIGTGWPVEMKECAHVGSAVCGPFVWHVFQEMRR